MSLNKRSLRKDAKAEPSLEDQLRAHERALKSRRGSNRRAAFVALHTQDAERAIDAVEAILEGTSGANRAELGALLASTGIAKYVDAALKGKYGDVDVHAILRSSDLHDAIGAFPDTLAKLQSAEIERRARALGIVPLVDNARFRETERALTALVDDTRLALAFRKRAAECALSIAPNAVWSRRDQTEIVDVALAIAAGLSTRYVAPDSLDFDAFIHALAALSSEQRALRIRGAQLPMSAQKLPAALRVQLGCVVLDEPAVDDTLKENVALDLARMQHKDAVAAVLARPDASPMATVVAAAQVSAEEAHDVVAPLLRASEAARAAFIASKLVHEPRFLDDAVALLAVDFERARSMLQQSTHPRAKEELARLEADPKSE